MLIKLQRLLGLGCLTERTLLLPPATFSALAGLVDLQALRSAGYCLESSKRDLWRVSHSPPCHPHGCPSMASTVLSDCAQTFTPLLLHRQ